MTRRDSVRTQRESEHLELEIQTSKAKPLLVLAVVLFAGLWPTRAAIAQGSNSDIPDKTPLVQLDYPNVPEAPNVQSLAGDLLQLRIVSRADVPVVVDIEARSLYGNHELTKLVERIPLDPGEQRAVMLEPDVTPDHSGGSGRPSQLLITGRIQDHTGTALGNSQAPMLFYYRDTRDLMFVYRGERARGDSAAGGGRKSDDGLSTLRFDSTLGVVGGGTFEPPTVGPARSPAMGKLVQICIRLKVNFSDMNYGEDFWKDNADKPAYGVWVRVYDSNRANVYNGFTGDGVPGTDGDAISGEPGAGCTPSLMTYNLSGWSVSIDSRAEVNDNLVYVYNDPETQMYVTWNQAVNLSAGVNTISIPYESPESSALAAATFGLYRQSGGMNDKTYKIRTGALENLAFPLYGYEGRIELTNQGSRKKFVVLHEMGHLLLKMRVNQGYGVPNTSYVAEAPCGSLPGNKHTMFSKEYSSGAFNEGFADFYAALVLNNTSETDGKLKVWDDVFGLESPGMYMKTTCSAPFFGFGNESDWMRFFWDFLTDPGVKPTFSQILNLIAAAPALEAWNAYFRLESSRGNSRQRRLAGTVYLAGGG